jgi:lysozyme
MMKKQIYAEKIGLAGINLIKKHEKCVLHVYYDGAGYGTIGWGHKIKTGEKFKTITQETADELLQQDLKIAESCITKYVKKPLKQYQFDALGSLIFNIGVTHFVESTLLKMLNSNNVYGAASQFLVWDKITNPKTGQKETCDELFNRRREEKSMFLGEKL